MLDIHFAINYTVCSRHCTSRQGIAYHYIIMLAFSLSFWRSSHRNGQKMS